MKITVVGATGLIGAQVVEILSAAGHDVNAASRSSGVDALTGDGVAQAVESAEVIVDVLNSPTLEPDSARDFFTTSASTLLTAGRRAGVRHHVLLSIVGVGTLEADGYLRGKHLQEELVVSSGIPYTIVRATQFHEFTEGIVGSLLVDGTAHAPDALIQPVAAAEVGRSAAAATVTVDARETVTELSPLLVVPPPSCRVVIVITRVFPVVGDWSVFL